MQVKVGSLWYRAEPGQPVAVYLEPQDKWNVENMDLAATMYSKFHADEPMNWDERREWLEGQRPPIPEARHEELLDELSEHVKNVLLEAGLSCGDHADPDDHDQGMMECVRGLLLCGELDASALLSRSEEDPPTEPQGERETESASPRPPQFTSECDSGGTVVADTQRYRVTSYHGGTGVEVLRRADQHSVFMQGDDAARFLARLDGCGGYLDDDRVCEDYDDVMRYDDAAAACYRRDERRRAFKVCRDAGIDVRAVRPEGWGGES